MAGPAAGGNPDCRARGGACASGALVRLAVVDLRQGDCRAVMAGLPAASVDAVVCDPPYGLSFMGKDWDHGIPGVAFWSAALRVAKPGAHLLAFGGTRTFHRLAVAIEDAGWEIRDTVMWVYGSGFPKSLNIGKAIDKAAGAPVKVGKAFKVAGEYGHRDLRDPEAQGLSRDEMRHSAATAEAKQWDGWGTALKPAHEPIVMARKPLDGTVAQNVIWYGTGALNIDECRVGNSGGGTTCTHRDESGRCVGHPTGNRSLGGGIMRRGDVSSGGRFPANFIHDGSDEVLELFPVTAGGARPAKATKPTGEHYEGGWGPISDGERIEFVGGSSARFFYCAKASKKDRNEGLDDFQPKRDADRIADDGVGGANPRNRSNTEKVNHHPTVKPTDLMRYLCRLVTPPGGTILDPFTGSGSTGKAAVLEGFNFIGIELDPDYIAIAEARIQHAYNQRH